MVNVLQYQHFFLIPKKWIILLKLFKIKVKFNYFFSLENSYSGHDFTASQTQDNVIGLWHHGKSNNFINKSY